MAKRHHSSKVSKMQSDPMPNRVHEGYHESSHEMYAGPQMSKGMMSRDGGLIHDDWSQPCLLPKNVIDRDWPKARGYGLNGSSIGDLFSEANRQMSSNNESMDEEKGFLHY